MLVLQPASPSHLLEVPPVALMALKFLLLPSLEKENSLVCLRAKHPLAGLCSAEQTTVALQRKEFGGILG